MKKTISIIALVFISVAGYSQAKQAWTPTLSESQCEKLYQLISAGKVGIFDSNQISAASAKNISMFGDSLINVMAAEYKKWHPDPPAPAKNDSSSNKKP